MSGKKIHPPIILYTGIALMIILHFVVPGMWLIPRPYNYLGLLPLIIGVVINLLADKSFSTRGTTVKPGEESSALVKTGVFRFTRNPMYLGFTFGLIGIGVLLGSLTPWLVVVAFPIVIETIYIRIEEKMLEETFGEEYRTYKGTTRRWI